MEKFLSQFQKKEVTEFPNSVTQTPKVSISVLTYNHKQYINQCLDGILKQETSFPFELLLGEDGSTDGTREICKEYAEMYPEKIRLFLHHRENNIKINGQPTGRFNFLYNIFSARGKFIALCEGDDYWTDPLKLQKQVNVLEQDQTINLCFHRANLFKKNTVEIHSIPGPFQEKSFEYIELLNHYNFITTASVMYRRPQKLSIPEWFFDIPFGDLAWYKIINEKKKFRCLNEVMSVYRIHKNGMWSGLNRMDSKISNLIFYKRIYPFLECEEKKVILKKIDELIIEISRIKFPTSWTFQKAHYIFFRFKFSLRTWLQY